MYYIYTYLYAYKERSIASISHSQWKIKKTLIEWDVTVYDGWHKRFHNHETTGFYETAHI